MFCASFCLPSLSARHLGCRPAVTHQLRRRADLFNRFIPFGRGFRGANGTPRYTYRCCLRRSPFPGRSFQRDDSTLRNQTFGSKPRAGTLSSSATPGSSGATAASFSAAPRRRLSTSVSTHCRERIEDFTVVGMALYSARKRVKRLSRPAVELHATPYT